MEYAGPRFRRRFVGYDRSAVDMEFDKLLSQVDEEVEKNEELRREIKDLKEERRDWEYAKRTLEEERSAISRDRASLAESVSSISGKVAELENSLSSAKVANEALQNKIDATASEKNQLQLRLDTVQERNRELTLRERQFDEIEKSVSSIMSVTKRATDRLFQKSVENQENVIRIAGDAAQEAAIIRADLTAARDEMNVAFDEFQDRIDKIDASLTGAVHKLVAIKHDSGLKPKNAEATIESEVERLLSMRAGEVDYSDGKGYAVPVLGPYSAKFISDAAKKVNSGEIEGNPPYVQTAARGEAPHARPGGNDVNDGEKSPVEIKKTFPGLFESSEASIKEANRLLDDADDAAERRNHVPLEQQYAQRPTAPPPYQPQPGYSGAYTPYPAQPYSPGYGNPAPQRPIGFGIQETPEESAGDSAGGSAGDSAGGSAGDSAGDSAEPQVNPYSGDGYEQVDISKLSAGGPTINMNSPELQYIGQPQTIGGMFDAPAVELNMSQPTAASSNAASYAYAGAGPTFIPDASVISADAQESEAVQESAAPQEEAVPSAKRVEVTKRVRSVPMNEKVRIMVRHGK